MKVLNPPQWPKPKGYANGISVNANARMIYTAGVVGWNAEGEFPDDFLGQLEQALNNTVEILAQDNALPEHIVRMVWYITDKSAYLQQAREAGALWRSIIGRHFPAMAVVEVTALMEDAAQIEIESVAAVE